MPGGLEHRERVKQALADPRGMEILVDQTAAEEEQVPDLDSAGVGNRTWCDLDRGGSEGNALVGRAASTDHRAGGEAHVGHDDVVAGRTVERAGQAGAARGQAGGHDDQDPGAGCIGADDCQVEGDPIREAAAGVLGLDVDGLCGGAAARIDARRVEDQAVAGVTDSGEVSARPNSGAEVDIVSADAQVGQRRARR